MNPLLEIRNVSLSYHTVSGETKALSNISFDLMPGEFLAVVGPSGCGKSTLLNLICGMLPAEEGTILMNGIPPSLAIRALDICSRKIIFWSGEISIEMSSSVSRFAEKKRPKNLPISKKCLIPTGSTNSAQPVLRSYPAACASAQLSSAHSP